MSASFLSDLRSLLGVDGVLDSPGDLAGYIEDWRGRHGGPACCVALPHTTEQVAEVVRLAARARVPVLPQGGNTSLCGGSVPEAKGPAPVIINLSRMRRVRSIDVANNSIEVEAGCLLAAVQQAAADHGRFYPVSLGAEGSCQIGGNIATNAGGTSVLRYGTTRDNVLGLEVVLPDGRIWNGLYRLRKNNTGLDLKHLFIGSEGTLGVITAATLKLHPLPTAHAVAWVGLADPKAALALLGLFQQRCGGVLSAYELMNALELQIVLEHVRDRRSPVAGRHAWHVLIELSDAGNEQALDETLQSVLQLGIEQGLIEDAVLASSGAQRAAMWEVRHSVSEGNKKAGVGLNTDCAVPLSAVPEFIERATRAAHGVLPGLPIVVVAHLGDGNVHFIPMVGFTQWESLKDKQSLAESVKHAIDQVAHDLGGTFSAEHGIGQILRSEMALFKPAVEISMMRGIKQLLDPHDLFNPGRVLPAGPSNP